MKSTVLVIMIMAVLAGVFAAKGQTQVKAWIPGTVVYVDELKAGDRLEHTYDSAYCDGITRFGKQGRFPYEKYHVFDCSIIDDRVACMTWRMASVKARGWGHWRLKLLRKKDCF